ncbi:MAG: stress response translation initiation inhibitor YciH [Gammaproteobacteria bacterium]
MSKNSRLVYSTDSGRIKSAAAAADMPPTGDGIVRIRRETKGRGGKGVSVITGLGLPAAKLKPLAKALKQRCGVGGAVKKWDIEIQGDQREVLQAELEKRGFTVKLAGG